MTLKVGDTLWYVEGYTLKPAAERGSPVEVLSIGRKWAYLKPTHYGRIDKDTLLADGGQYSTDSRAYLSRDAYLARISCDKAWRAFYRAVYNTMPPGVSEDAIRQAAAALNITLED